MSEARAIMNRHDPMGFVSAEYPENEYDPETAQIVALLNKGLPITQVALGIARVFWKQFGDPQDDPPDDGSPFETLAQDMMQMYERVDTEIPHKE